jgi:hypothetical protein
MTRLLRFGAAAAALTLVLAGAAAAGMASRQSAGFNHSQHKGFFPDCTGCHAGIVEEGKPVWPVPAETCEACHDGSSRKRVDWKPREGPRPTNLTFAHSTHSFTLDECRTCHVASEADSARMDVQRAVVASCQACHEIEGTHPALPDSSCSLCHVPLTRATLLSRQTIAGFPEPESHREAGWVLGNHGKAATVAGEKPNTFTVAASCATCHARNQCIDCHVNAPEVQPIQALGLDDRAPAIDATLPVPASHGATNWDRTHGDEARKDPANCTTCHAQESCRTCHSAPGPRALRQVPATGTGRGAGVQLTRTPPASHTFEFRDRHGPAASATGATCETCHVRESCLSCHRPNTSGSGTYHPNGFLTRHPSSAWNRDANCSDCHNPAQFCQTCHKQAGLVSTDAKLGAKGFHDGYPGFSVGHGQVARQNLESCASCHAQRDCTTCHATALVGGYGLSPHGPGFDAERLQKKNKSLCTACHGSSVPNAKR